MFAIIGGLSMLSYDAAEGLLSSTILLLAEFLPPDEEHPEERRHIVSVFKLVQDSLEPARGARGRSRFQLLMDKLPSEHKARWLAAPRRASRSPPVPGPCRRAR